MEDGKQARMETLGLHENDAYTRWVVVGSLSLLSNQLLQISPNTLSLYDLNIGFEGEGEELIPVMLILSIPQFRCSDNSHLPIPYFRRIGHSSVFHHALKLKRR